MDIELCECWCGCVEDGYYDEVGDIYICRRCYVLHDNERDFDITELEWDA